MMKKALIVLILIAVLVVPLTGCFEGYSEAEIMDMIEEWLADYEANQEESSDAAEAADLEGLSLRLTFPVGYSPNVFTTGWLFGASCAYEGTDYSNQVKWSGTGSFSPDMGSRSRPSFEATGANTITLTVEIEGKSYQQSFTVSAVSPAGYAAIGTLAQCDSYSFGCPACPHVVQGPITTGSSTVFVFGKPAARVGDKGIGAGGCGPAEYTITSGDSSVMIDGRPAAKTGSTTSHGGHVGKIIGP